MTMTRREWLARTGAAAAASTIPFVNACGGESLPKYRYDGPLGPETMFVEGVASGDPLADAVVLWTRVSPGATGPVEVWLDVAEDAAFARRVVARTFSVDESTDYTLKVDVDGLEAGTTYYYRFFALGRGSVIGRTRTLSVGPLDATRLAVLTCSNFGYGYFHAYRHVAARPDLDAVVHLGDYIYEYALGLVPFAFQQVRATSPAHEIVTLADYRARYRHYRTDVDLREAHRQHPWIVIWDDHEIADNAWTGGARNHQPATEGSYADRLAAARQAFFEYIPIRGIPSDGVARAFRFGDLVDLIMLDGRSSRSVQIDDVANDTADRTILGAEQEAWLASRLAASTTTWRVLGNPVPIAQFTNDAVGHAPIYLDQWDGYPAARERLLSSIEDDASGNVVVITGDLHGTVVYELTRDPWNAESYDPATGVGSLAVELVTPAVTSPYSVLSEATPADAQAVKDASPHCRFIDLSGRGFSILDVSRARVQFDVYHLDGLAAGQGNAAWVTGWVVTDGSTRANPAAGAAPAGLGPALAP